MAAGDGKNGTDVLLLVNTGTPTVPVYEAMGSQRDVSFEETTAEIDISSKDSRAWYGLPGRYKATLTLDALYIPDNAGYLALQAAMRDGTTILVAKQDDAVVTETATGIVTSLGDKDPDQAEATVSVAISISGEWTEQGT
jgi:hypothetical protein